LRSHNNIMSRRGSDEERETLLANDYNSPENQSPLHNEEGQEAVEEGGKEGAFQGPMSEAVEGVEVQDEDLTTVCEAFWNICNTIQGLPILAIPYTFKSGGWWSLLALVIIAVTSNYTSVILVKSLYEERDGVRVRVRKSYMDIGEAFWRTGGRTLVLVTMVIELVFVSTMYPILVGSMFNKSFPEVPVPLWGWTLIGGLALLPNALLKNLSQVAWTSIITVLSAFIIFISILAFSFTKVNEWDISYMNNFEAHEFPAALGILVACYLAQPFAPFIESTMKDSSKFIPTLNYAFLSMSVVNVTVGIISDVTFYPETDEVITNNLPAGIFRQIVNAMAAILAFTSYTLPMFTSFDIIEKSGIMCIPVGFGYNVYRCPVQTFRLGLVCTTICMAAFIPKFTYLLAFVGSLTGITLEFIFPALFHMKIYCSSLRWYEFALDIAVVFLGTMAMTVSLMVSWVSMYNCFVNRFC